MRRWKPHVPHNAHAFDTFETDFRASVVGNT
jgi:hypothetical protein